MHCDTRFSATSTLLVFSFSCLKIFGKKWSALGSGYEVSADG